MAKEKTGTIGYPVFLWVGQLTQNKDALTVVQAFLKFAAMRPKARLYMIYQHDTLLHRVKALLHKNDVENVVTLVGEVTNDELLFWYNSADFFISGSLYDESGTAVCEAMSCGCIPIVTDIAAFNMITDSGKCGISYLAGNDVDLLRTLIKTGDLDIKEKQKRSLEHFRSKLSFEAIAKQIHEVAVSL